MLQTIRNLLSSGGKPAKERRRLPPAGGCPRVGASVYRNRVLMKINEPVPQNVWDWLVLSGWREVRMSNNRRRYRTLPNEALHRLLRCPAEERESVHRSLVGPDRT